MNIAELKGEKTVASLAERLFKQSSERRDSTAERDLEAALLRLNPHLNDIASLEPGTRILVPDNVAVNASESGDPRTELAGELLREGAASLRIFRSALKESRVESSEQAARVQTWLKSEEAKRMTERAPNVREAFASAAAAAASVAKERAAELEAEDKALRKVEASLAEFLKRPRGPSRKTDANAPGKARKRSSRSPQKRG